MSVLEFLESCLEIRSEDVAYTETVTADLVGIGRSDTFQCGADLALSGSCFVCRIQKPVCRQDKVSLLGNVQFGLGVDAHLADVAALLAECDRVKNHTVSDDVRGTLPENT